VRTRVGLFDVSHMGEISVRGDGALEFLQRVTCNDVSRLRPGRAHYNGLITPAGTFVDDLLVYRLEEADFLLVVNAANTDKDADWLQSHAGGHEVVVEDVSASWTQLAIQGPRSLEVLQPLVSTAVDRLKYYRFVRAEVLGAPCIVSRTGYTGEYGFEVYAPADAAERIWTTLLDSGSGHGLVPVGLAARDTLRLEAKMALYGNDIDETTTVVEADLAWIVKPAKGEFIGRDVLVRQLEQGVERRLVGFEMLGRGIARHGYPACHNGETVGRVTSGTHSPTLRKAIGLAYLPVELTEPATEFEVTIRDRSEPAVVVPTPFYKRPKDGR
jgi:aminomethyltransferase